MSRYPASVVVGIVLLLAVGTVAAQSTTSGSIRGTVTDPDGGIMPGATVVAASDALIGGQQVAIASGAGVYRFPSLPPGLYTLEAQLSGFQTVRREGIQLGLGQALEVDLQLGDPEFAEEIVVVAEGVQVSTVSNSVAHNLDQSFIERQPVTRDPTSLMNFAPGVVDGQAYGAPSDYQNAYNLDGVDVSDPALGSQWVLPSMDWVQEVQVVGLGADAEYGGFTGAVVNLITKSGGNDFSGDVRLFYSDESFNSDTTPPNAEGSNVVSEDWDASFSLGGPIVRDRAWFFVSGNERERGVDPFYAQGAPLGDRSDTTRAWSRYVAKATFQANPSNRIVGLVNYDAVEEDYRGVGDLTLASATEIQDSPNLSYNISWESLIGDSSFINAKLTGFEGEDERRAHNGDIPGRYDLDSGFEWQNLDQTSDIDKSRQTVDLSWSLFADGLLASKDSHNFKFGVVYETLEDDEVTNRIGGFTYVDDTYFGGPDGFGCATLDDYFSNPFCGRFSSDRGDELDIHAEMEGLHLYAQDSWQLGRVTLNVGARYTSYQGSFKNASGDVYDVDMIAPRAGGVWDVFGDGSTALKVHYGQYYDGISVVYFDREVSGNAFSDLEFWDWDFDAEEWFLAAVRPQGGAVMDPNIDHPYIEQYVATFERQLADDMLVGVDYIHRENKDIVAMVTSNTGDYLELFAPGDPAYPATGGGVPFFELLSPPEFEITNPAGATREYDSVVLRLAKRYRDGWSLDTSLVWSDLTGNADFALAGYVDDFEDLNGTVNASGDLPFNSEWVFKVSTSVDLPWGIMGSAFYQWRSGETWTPTVRLRGLLDNDRTTVFLTERGSEEYEDRDVLDLHLEKSFALGRSLELTLMVDAFNVLDSDEVTLVQQRWGDYFYQWDAHPEESEWAPSSTYKDPISIQTPREVRLGAKLTF